MGVYFRGIGVIADDLDGLDLDDLCGGLFGKTLL